MPSDAVTSVLVYRCGTCGAGVDSEAALRAHQDAYRLDPTRPAIDQPEEHDGEPWMVETVRVGDRYVWEPENPKARSDVTVTKIAHNGEECWVWTEGTNPPGVWPNELARFAEAVWPGSYQEDADEP